MIDYKNIADNDPGGDLDVAYEAMKKETVKSYPKKMMTYLDIANLLDLSKSKELQDAVVGIADIPEFVDHELKSGGLDVNDVKSQYMLRAIVSEDTANAIIGLGAVVTLAYPNFKIGHLSNARHMRLEGRR